MGHRRAALRDPALPLPSLFPISPSSHCLVGLAKGVCCSLNHCSPEPKAGHLQRVGLSSGLELFLYLLALGLNFVV